MLNTVLLTSADFCPLKPAIARFSVGFRLKSRRTEKSKHTLMRLTKSANG